MPALGGFGLMEAIASVYNAKEEVRIG